MKGLRTRCRREMARAWRNVLLAKMSLISFTISSDSLRRDLPVT